jgi:hypothetical protein
MSKENKNIDAVEEQTLTANKVDEAEQAPPATMYQVVMAQMTPEMLASLGVKLISVNNSELYWVTSAGQLYAFNAQQQALEAEYAWLMSKPE